MKRATTETPRISQANRLAKTPARNHVCLVALATVLVLGAGIGVPQSAHAALAPNYQRLAEFRAVLDSAALAETFDVRRPLERLDYLGPDEYRASGGGCQVDLAIVAGSLPKGMVGPRQFSVRAAKAVCN